MDNAYYKKMEKMTQLRQAVIRKCLQGLTAYAARLAAEGQTDPRLRELVSELPEFWGIEADMNYLSAFDKAVSEAGHSGQAPALEGPAQEAVLAGLNLYAAELREASRELEPWARGCEVLAGELRKRWQSAASSRLVKPDCQLIGQNGNIFKLIAIASHTLQICGFDAQAEEMRKRILGGECHDYSAALNVIGEYVNITGPDMEMGGMGL